VIPVILQAEKKWEDLIFQGFSDEERSLIQEGMRRLAENSLENCNKRLKDK
jgi:DNA-binding MarR family transcriptional regulator